MIGRSEDVTLARTSTKSDRRGRELAAELAVLEAYDDRRRRAGYDYGNAQRHYELVRRRGELEAYPPRSTPPTPYELREAFRRIGAPRLERALEQRETWGGIGALRTVRVWRELGTVFA